MEYMQQFSYEIDKGEIAIKKYLSRNIEKLSIPEKINGLPITVISENAFRRCKSMKEIVIADSVKKIGAGAFMECSELEHIKLPEKINKIDSDVFKGCHKLSTIDIPISVTEISSGAFSACVNLETIVIPQNVENIMEGAFSDCIKLSSIIILTEKLKFGFKSFYHCGKLDSVTVKYEKTRIDFFSQRELAIVNEIKVRILNSDGSFNDVRVFIPTDESGKGAYDDFNKNFCEIFQKGFTWERYDKACTLLTKLENKLDIAAYRMKNNYSLTPEIEKNYYQILKDNAKTAIKQFINDDDDSGLEVMTNIGGINRLNIGRYIRLSEKLEGSKCTEFLSEYKKSL